MSEVKNFYINEFGYTIFIADYHSEYTPPKDDHVTTRFIWDWFKMEYVFKAMRKLGYKVPDPDDNKNWEKSNAEIALIRKKYIEEYGPCENIVLEAAHDEPASIWEIHGKKEALLAYAAKWGNDILNELPHVSGDDSTFDYFPGYVEMFWQFCKALDLKKLYEEVGSQILQYYKDRDMESEFEGVEKF